ncbi:type II toxin-antitoxin system RelE/ParE family toxin [Lentibacillus sp. L22]|uniref:type II toxin-antitoxin system RelE/ParE family toxin n=1 Tax=Lentibacillus sp. L22 TaxID=3163028 RepID=UPI003466889E
MLPVTYLNPAERYFKKLKEKPLKKRFLEKIQEIRLDPYIGELKTGDLAGIYCCDIKYKGINYELAYRLEENQDGELVVVIMAGTRETFYQELKRYIK